MALFGDTVGGRDLPAREVARSDIHNFAFADQLLHRLPDFFPGRVAIDMVHLVEVDMVGLKPSQAILAGFADMVGRQPSMVRPVARLADTPSSPAQPSRGVRHPVLTSVR